MHRAASARSRRPPRQTILEVPMFSSRDTRPSDVGHELDRLRADFSRLADTVTSLMRDQSGSAQSSVRGFVDTARDQVASRAAELGRSGQAFAYEARDRIGGANAALENRIERNPLKSVLIAAGIGLVLGLISRHRS
jgi:ElaB/YqjD/DUF883 family membrane-anchored ribosome-binding protein